MIVIAAFDIRVMSHDNRWRYDVTKTSFFIYAIIFIACYDKSN